MKLFGKFRQFAYVTNSESFEQTLDWWADTFGAGPFYLKNPELGLQSFRGKPSNVTCEIALTYLGDTQLEIIRPTNEEPSPYREYLDAVVTVPPAGVFHHVLVDTDDYDGMRTRLLEAGCDEGLTATASFGRRMCYLDGTRVLGHYVELVESSDFNTVLCELMKRKSQDWDGEELRRNYGDLVDEVHRLVGADFSEHGA